MDNDVNSEQIYLMQQTYATLFAVTNKLQVLGDKTSHKLTSRQFMTLLAIAHIDNEASLSNVARKLGTTKQSVKQILVILEKQKYVAVTPSSFDKRTIQIKLTQLGETIMEEYYEIGKSVLSTWFYDFSKEELQQFYFLLKKLYHFDGQHHDGFEKEMK